MKYKISYKIPISFFPYCYIQNVKEFKTKGFIYKRFIKKLKKRGIEYTELGG